uniref:Secreted protein n=1 Tax=Aegilops tauschii subsp. strangulata TaxID=200361 RepID=A0A453T6U6_AEGTS
MCFLLLEVIRLIVLCVPGGACVIREFIPCDTSPFCCKLMHHPFFTCHSLTVSRLVLPLLGLPAGTLNWPGSRTRMHGKNLHYRHMHGYDHNGG